MEHKSLIHFLFACIAQFNGVHYGAVIMGAIASQITSLTIVYSTVSSDQRKHQSSASLTFVCGIHRGPVNSPHKWPVTRKRFPFDDVIMSHWYVIHRGTYQSGLKECNISFNLFTLPYIRHCCNFFSYLDQSCSAAFLSLSCFTISFRSHYCSAL